MADIGRPSKYDPAFCDDVVAFLAQGYSIAAFAGKIGVDPATVKRWADDGGEFSKPEFCDAVKIGRAKAVLWWEERNRELAMGESKANPVSVIFGLKNRAKDEWSDKVTHANDPENPLPDSTGTALGKLADTIDRLASRQSPGE
jgi:hypothetical protein